MNDDGQLEFGGQLPFFSRALECERERGLPREGTADEPRRSESSRNCWRSKFVGEHEIRSSSSLLGM